MREPTTEDRMESVPPEADGQELLGVALPDQYLGFFLVFLMDFEQFLPDQAMDGNTKRRAPVCSQS